jgi:thiol-disulfide isomerase/thioredoxin
MMDRIPQRLAGSAVEWVIYPLFLVFFTFWCLAPPGPARAGEVEEVNQGRGGESLDINDLKTQGRVTVVDFFSPYCPPCLRLAPLLHQLAQVRDNLVIKKVDINRPGVSGIDWNSPLARQYSLHSVPYFVIYNPKGKLVAEGAAAKQQVLQWLREAGLMKE